ncbi:unnamed protein product [Hymenolepis diminuta]|uniref:Ig-like domain-containing protein n=1 Tax=Hymenolepis diminuta TaxID=6216 RepID=A0A158QBL4_HYMDI|nr:unnamed protein product [Hymenolepis diminuta]
MGRCLRNRVIPSIVSLPAPVTYLDRLELASSSSASPTLICEVWPPTANTSFYIAHPYLGGGGSSPSGPRSHLSLEPIPTGPSSAPFRITRRIVPGNASLGMMDAMTALVPAFSNAAANLEVLGGDESNIWARVDSVDVHCRVDTKFGAVLSAPFRVVLSKLPELSTPSDFPQTRVKEFINGNVAFVSCRIPQDSQPPPIVQFYLNGSLIDNMQKYKQVHRPNEDQVILLINSFKASDEGDYRCTLTNPVTKATVWSPEIIRLQVRTPDKPVPARIILPLVPQDNSSAAATRQLVVREGDNVTLFCIMEGAPPPEVHTHPHNTQNNRYIMDEVFARLRLTQSPQDIRLSSLGKRAEFRCSSSNPSVTPFWLFNGEPFYTISPQVLVIDSVKESDLGLYQCIARTLTPDGRTDEWVSATALLSLYSDKIVTKAADLAEFIPNVHRMPTSHPEALTVTKEMTPLVEMALDNFAVYLAWNVSEATLYSSYHGQMAGSSSNQLQSFQGQEDQPIAFQIDYATLLRESVLNPALEGLIPPEPALWSKTERLNKMWKKMYGFVIGLPLEPGKTYRFRVRAVSTETGENIIPPSGWSEPISTHHISSAPPPRITSVQPYHDGRFNVTWEYDGDLSNQSTGDGATESFRPDFFLILVRPVLRSPALSKSLSDDEKSGNDDGSQNDNNNDAVVHYGRYRATQVNGSDAREAFIYNLNSSISYQLVVYGVKYENGERRITRFSEAKFATLPEIPGFGSFSLIRAVTENKPIFIGLGALALIIFLVALILVIMCIARQRKYRRRRRVKHNGFLTGHTESEKYPSQSQQVSQNQQSATSVSDHLRANSPSAVKAVQASQGQAMLMGTLMRQSNFSDTASNQQYAQQQQFAQQQAAYMGSAMHIGGGGASSGFYGTHHHPHHHSHHSLLLPTPTGGPMVGGGPMFHSGTLPPGMRAGGMHLQSPPPPAGGFGSQQVLNQLAVEGMDPQQQQQATLMRDYYHQQQQQQQIYQQHLMNQQQQQASFMQYGTHNPAAYLSPQQQQQQMMDTLTRQHSQSYPYGGSIHSGASLKRDPNGSMHEETATLLARSPMSPHPPPMLGDQIPPPGYFQTPMYGQQHPLMSPPPPPVQMSGAPYYPGQPQSDPMHMTRMHGMGHHTDGESIYSYFSQQDVCHPQSHAMLNPLPEENQMNLGYTESGSQTAGLNGTSGTASPHGGGTVSGHRHHRRRRRKQQQSSQSSQQFGSGSGEGDGFQFPGHNGENIALMAMMDGQGRNGSNSGMNGVTPPSAAGLEQPGGGNETVNQINLRSGNQSFDRSTPSYGGNQPPPPPPPAMMMMPPMQMGDPSNQGGVVMGNLANSGSLSRRAGPNPGSVLGGAPPRIRDYSEYGIPTSVPGNSMSQPPPASVVAITGPSATTNNNNKPQLPNSASQNTGGTGSLRYREGQA